MTDQKPEVRESDVFELYRKVASKKLSKSRRVYTDQLLCWLMVTQQLNANPDLRSAMSLLDSDEASLLQGNCVRVREKRISRNSSAYSQARKSLRKESLESVLDELFLVLKDEDALWNGREVTCIDGTSISLPPTKSLCKAYPPTENQHGKSIIPIMHVLVAHDLMSGLAHCPIWGAKYGEHAVGEQTLAKELFRKRKTPQVFVGDCNFGVFSVVYSAQQYGHESLFRLTEARAKRVLGTTPAPETECIWRPTAADRKSNSEIPVDALIRGKLIAQKVFCKKQGVQMLYLFTTIADASREEILNLYSRRWEIETDLRYLKVPLRLDELRTKSPEMVEKELISAVIAYNLVRAVMVFAAREHGKDHKRLSFTTIYNLLKMHGPRLLFARSKQERLKIIAFILDWAASYVNYPDKRRNRPRTVYKRNRTFPPRTRPDFQLQKT